MSSITSFDPMKFGPINAAFIGDLVRTLPSEYPVLLKLEARQIRNLVEGIVGDLCGLRSKEMSWIEKPSLLDPAEILFIARRQHERTSGFDDVANEEEIANISASITGAIARKVYGLDRLEGDSLAKQ
jgi:hypothetical protein